MKRKILKDIIIFTVGFCLYMTIECCLQGYSYPFMGCCCGLAMIVLDKINDKISWNVDLLIQAVYGANLITLLEFVIGFTAKYTDILPIMWDCSNMPNFMGIIRIPFYFAWMALSILAIFVSDAINYYIFSDTICPYYLLLGGQIRLKFIPKETG